MSRHFTAAGDKGCGKIGKLTGRPHVWPHRKDLMFVLVKLSLGTASLFLFLVFT